MRVAVAKSAGEACVRNIRGPIEAIELMLQSLATMLVSILSLYFLPIQFVWMAGVVAYGFLLHRELRAGVWSPITVMMLILYLGLGSARTLPAPVDWLAFLAPGIYATLGTLSAVLLLRGRPFSTFYARGQGYMPLHRTVSVLWTLLHLSAATASLLLMPDLAFIFVPIALMLIGTGLTLVLQFVSMGPAHGRRKAFVRDELYFRQASRDEAEVARFYNLFACERQTDTRKFDPARRNLNLTAVARKKRAADDKYSDALMRFVAFKGEELVGTICLYLDHPFHGLPIEEESGLNLNPLRRIGVVAEVGKLALAQSHRFSQAALLGLFKCAIEYALVRNVSFILNHSLFFQAKLYEKIGFKALLDGPYLSHTESISDVPHMPMVMNLARHVYYEEDDTAVKRVGDLLNPYLTERTFKRIVVKELIWRNAPRPHDLSETALSKLLEE